jgi:hypothetical protein
LHNRVTTATNVLYAGFAERWNGNQRSLIEAFEQFKKALVEGGSWGYRHLVVRPVYPHRTK